MSALDLHRYISLTCRTDIVSAGIKSSSSSKNFKPSTRKNLRSLIPDGIAHPTDFPISLSRSLSSHSPKVKRAPIDHEIHILSPFSPNETPRSSGDFQVMSTSSTDTLISEYPSHNHNRPPRVGGPDPFFHKSPQASTMTEVLMMGYGQIAGYLTLDGSLIKQQSFEHVRRKWVIGSQGGRGVVIEKNKPQSGLFSTLKWGNLGESITEILGGDQLSSLKQSKDSGGLRSIPILSTPQSVLFVDLKLGPGQSKSFTYRCPLPSAIPPTHKGRAMKVYYHLTIGTQRAATVAPNQQISTIDIPFRVVTGLPGETSFLKIPPSS